MGTSGWEGVIWYGIFVWVVFMSCHSVWALTDPIEKQALLAFKNSLVDTDGELDSWKESTDPCTGTEPWSHVFCEVDDYPVFLKGSNFSHVTELRLLSLNLGGQLVDDLGDLQGLKFLDVMWNQMTGSIPPSIGKLSNLFLLLLNGNNFTGVLPDELGNLSNLNRIQIDQNSISGPVPATFTKLTNIQHLHMNNNSLNGSIPAGLGVLPKLVHVLLDNNQLTGTLPPDLSNAPSLLIIQLDNNHFNSSARIPASYGQIPTLLKLSLRNCGMQGTIPSIGGLTNLKVLDLSHNNLTGQIPIADLPPNMTAMDVSYNSLSGAVPRSVGDLDVLQTLLVRNNNLSGEIPVNLGTGASFSNITSPIILDFQDNALVLDSGSNLVTLQSQGEVQVWLAGNAAACSGPTNPLCVRKTVNDVLELNVDQIPPVSNNHCSPCKSPYLLVPNQENCRCANPITVRYRLKSPGFTVFDLYEVQFLVYISQGLKLELDQVQIKNYTNQAGPRIAITLYLFPLTSDFNSSELTRLFNAFTQWGIPDSMLFGPYELIQFILPGSTSSSSGGPSSLSSGALAGIIVGAVLVTSVLAAAVMFFFLKRRGWDPKAATKVLLKRAGDRKRIKVAGVQTFTFEELVKATDNFSEQNVLGRGGYGKVYYGVLADGQKVAVKRAEEGSLQGAHEFETEIQLLSRVHHRNLVSLVGYCNDDGEHYQGEQMLVYEFIPNGTLRDHLMKAKKHPLDILSRLRIALGSARGIHYLHTQANPPIFHRDIKATNILLDEKFNAKVADFGLSKLAPADVDFEGGNAGHVSTLVKGTPGYLDPEYFLTHKLTDKSDVYSFGVVLLELVTGRLPISQGKNIVREVSTAFARGELPQMVDPRMGSYPSETVEPLTKLALACCSNETESRPSMQEVLHELEEIWKETPWSDVASHSYVGDLEDPHDFPSQSRFINSTNLYDRSDPNSNSDLLSGTNINVQPR